MNIVRTLGIFLALAALSFVLGFFVLARLIPGSSKPAMAATIPGSGPPSVEPRDRGAPGDFQPALDVQPRKSAEVASGDAALPKPKATPGPSLDPAGDAPAPADPAEVQKPRRVDDNPSGDVASNSDDGSGAPAADDAAAAPKPHPAQTPTPTVHPRRRRHAAAHKTERTAGASTDDTIDTRDNGAETDTQDPPVKRSRQTRRAATEENTITDSEDAPVKRTHRARRPRAASTEEQDTSGEESDQPTRTRRATADTPSGGYYHVHLGAFHSRDAADHEVQRARAKGFEAQIVPTTRRGRTLYRVQAGAYRDKERAESVKQSLQDASLDATVTEPRR